MRARAKGQHARGEQAEKALTPVQEPAEAVPTIRGTARLSMQRRLDRCGDVFQGGSRRLR